MKVHMMDCKEVLDIYLDCPFPYAARYNLSVYERMVVLVMEKENHLE